MDVERGGDFSRRQRLFVVLCGIFLTALLIANVIAGKEFRLGGLQLSVGVIPFPITFLLTDIVNEYYGKEGARFLTLVGLVMMLFANAMLILGGLLPTAANSWVSDQSYQNVFGLSWRLFLGSLCAYVLGQVSDIYSFQAMKRITGSRMLWLRATGSTFFSQVIDTVVVNFAIFAGMKSWDQLSALIFWSYVYKMVVAVGLTPLLYVAHAIIKRWLGITAEPVEAPRPA